MPASASSTPASPLTEGSREADQPVAAASSGTVAPARSPAVTEAALRIPVFTPWLPESSRRYVLDCIDTGWISSLGTYVPRFEEELARFCQARHAVATANGTVALHLALAVLGIGPGDEVLVPDLTFVATANAVRYTGATPVLVDVEPESWGMDPADARRKVTARTRAAIPVHLYGRPAALDPLLVLAAERGFAVVEDAAEAHGASYRGRRVGAIGRIGAFSFYGNKIFTTGEGGAVVTDDPQLAARAAFLRDHAMDPARRYFHPEVGYNYRMTNIQAALGCSQLEHAEEILRRRRAIARAYDAGLAGIPGLAAPVDPAGVESVCWMYSVLVEPSFGRERDAVAAGLRARGIDSRPFFVPLHEMPPYHVEGVEGVAGMEGLEAPFPVASGLSRQGINLPSGTALTSEEIGAVCQALRELSKAGT